MAVEEVIQISLGGFLFDCFDEIPTVGQETTYNRWRFTVRELEGILSGEKAGSRAWAATNALLRQWRAELPAGQPNRE